MEDKQKQNKVIWKDTYRIAEKYPYANAEKISRIDDADLDLSTHEPDVKIIKVFNSDLITTVNAVVNAKFKPLVLIGANDNYPLESVKHGLISPECDLYRCSNICMATSDTMYPIRDLEMLYCPKVTIFKNSNNKLLPKSYQISLALASPVRRPALISIKTDRGMEDDYSNSLEAKKMKDKIENIFKLAVLKGFKCLILTDFGCQLEGNPIKKVIGFFNEAVKKYPIKYVFFSIKNTDPDSENKTKKKDKNFEQFHLQIKRNVKT